MQAGVLKALLEHVPDDVELELDVHDFTCEVGGVTYDEQYNRLVLTSVVYDDGPADDDEEPAEAGACGAACTLPEPTNSAIALI
jgi:hypothetical protein